MDADSFRPESHIQQQSRRYKLRIQQTSPHNLRKFPGDSQQLPLYPATVLPSEMAATRCYNFSSDHSGDGMVSRAIRGHEDRAQMITNVPNYGIFPESSLDVATSAGAGDPWRGHGSQHGSDWMVNYAGGSGVIEVLFDNSVSTSIPHQQLKPHEFDGYNDFDHEVSPAVVSGSNQPIYHSYLRSGNENYLVSRPAEAGLRWDDGLRHLARKSDQDLRTLITDAGTHGLSLSLSSNTSKMDVMQFREQLFDSEFLRPTEGNETEGSDQESKLNKLSSNSGAIPRPSIIRRTSGKLLQDLVSQSTSVHRSTGPLGPFTGYATILESSRFLKPAQELLDGICIGTSSLSVRVSEAPSDAMSGRLDNSGMSSSTFRSSNDGSGDRSSSRELFWPEYQQKKAKLLCLHEEVCRRYKRYHQQMQIVASSFELVAGLDAVTPFLSSALKTISRSFRSLKHAISDQLKQVMQTLGEEFLSPNAHATGSQVDAGVSGGANVAFLEHQQHAWRPQRGLPERAVAVLRAWLFEHFLHPYPTDTDKQMLASQTGLSRNQVSNWFINARVRVWKPMVEEIHMLETKGVPESNQSSRKNDATSCQGSRQTSRELSSNKATTAADCSGIGFSVGNDLHFRMEQWDQEKRQTSTFDPPMNMDESSTSFLPYHRGGLDIGSLGTVSLTLGLRHDVDKVQHRQQAQQHHDDQLMRLQFGGQMIRDFTV